MVVESVCGCRESVCGQCVVVESVCGCRVSVWL